MYIINAPMLFTGCWAIVKGFLDEKTREKISIVGSGFITKVLEVTSLWRNIGSAFRKY